MKKVFISLVALLIFSTVAFAKQYEDEINVMSFNIRLSTKVDAENWWEYRKDIASNVIKFYDVDLFGAQEVLHSQLMDMLDRLPGFGFVGVGRTDGNTKGEYSPILYRKDRFSVEKSGNFWLAEDMNAVGQKGWDAACERVATWAIFMDKETRKRFFVLNTHLDHMGKEARHNGAALVLKQVELLSENLPVIVTGDFNAIPSDDPIQVLTDAKKPFYLKDTRTLAPLRYGPEWTFHNFGRTPMNERIWIDYIFIHGNIQVLRHGVLMESVGNLYPSDHCPILSRIVIQ